jgi:hypothetical protein
MVLRFFFKQWGAFGPETDGHERGGIDLIDRRGQSWYRMEKPAPTGRGADAPRQQGPGRSTPRWADLG